MTDQEISGKVDIPKHDQWPGTLGAYRKVKPYIKPHIWDFVSAIGLALIVIIAAEIILGIIFKHSVINSVLDEVVSLIAGSFYMVVAITMYFKALNGDEFTLNEVIGYGYQRLWKMLGLIFVMYVLLAVSFVLFIIPFLIVLPRLYLAPYFFIYNESTVSEALAASWHLSKGHSSEIYGIIILDAVIGLLVLTIIGIPFAIYWYTINSGSFALITMSLAQPKAKDRSSKKRSVAEGSPA